MNIKCPLQFSRHLLAPALLLLLSLFSGGALRSTKAQTASSFDRERGRTMLSAVKDDIKKNYYDAEFHGLDLEARFKTADERIKQATSNGQILGIIAQAVIDLDDSHTFFMPPSHTARTDYGWQMQIIGDRCFVTAVKPESDAEAKGLKVGDEILSIDGYTPARENLWKMKYAYYSLKPRAGMRLVIRKPDGKETQLDVMAKIRDGKQIMDLTDNDIWTVIREAESEDRLQRQRFYEVGDDLLIWKMPEFSLTEPEVDNMMGRVRKRKALILDLRGNPGGFVTTLERLAGYFFDHDLKIADLKGRKEMKPQLAKTRGDNIFKGQLVVLVDSGSASAAEIFSRLVQLEKRGTLIGDRTSGAVMQSRHYPHKIGLDIVSFYGVSITNADVIMSDGKSLEKVGVTPDELLLPTANDMAAGRDPVLARAAELVGVKLDAEKAGTLFPIEWRK